MYPQDERRKTGQYNINDQMGGRRVIIAILLAVVVVAIVQSSKQNVLGPLLGAAGVAVALGFVAYAMTRRSRANERAIRSGPQLAGRAAKLGESYDRGGDIPFVVAEYEADGVTYRKKFHYVAGQTTAPELQWEVGQEIPLWLDPQNPRRAVLANLVEWK